ncbi:MAG: hypothetical protein PHU81_07450 [Acidobacteriota bacterium]|nr:hypothetical protein [Acidobacteriota bacterium]
MRKESLPASFEEKLPSEIEIERAINFGGFDYIKEVQGKYGMEKFIDVLMTRQNLRKMPVNYWCLVLGLEWKKPSLSKTFLLFDHH